MRALSRLDTRTAWWIAAVAAALVVFFCHFRPWEVGLLEEWGFADAWNRLGWSALFHGAGSDVGRPLQALVFYVPLSLGLGITGIQLLLGIVAVGQFALVLRFGGPHDGPRRWLLLVVALIVALHPLWSAGFILRFLGAQVAVLATIGALSLLYRYLRGGPAWLLVPSTALGIGALMTYQAPAAVLPLLALALSIMLPVASTRRRVLATLVTIGGVALSLLWSAVLAPRLAPAGSTYESALLDGSGGGGAMEAVTSVLRSAAHIPLTLATRAPATIVSIVVLLVVLVTLHRRVGMAVRATASLAALTVLALVAGIPYAVNPLHVLDPERVGGPAALTLGLVIMLWCVLSPPDGVRPQLIVATALLIATVVATVVSLSYWARNSSIQRSMLSLIAPAVTQATGRDRVLIEDGSGVLGDVYTGYYPDLSTSSHVYNGDPTNVVMCTVDGIARQRPVAEIFPLTTTKYCSALPVPPDARLVSRGEIAGGPVSVYIIGPSTGQDR